MRKETHSKRFLKVQQELASTTEYLHTVIENQEATNEELQSANEEILSSNEELQSTNEELETAKEELQSANEELTTVNDELRSRNQEITQANNDLQNLLASIDVAIVMLGSDLAIRRFTPEAQKVLGLLPTDLGRPFENINAGIDMPDLQQVVRGVMSDFIPVERAVVVRSGKPYLLRVTPYRTSDNEVDGVVLTMTLAMTLANKRTANLSASSMPQKLWCCSIRFADQGGHPFVLSRISPQPGIRAEPHPRWPGPRSRRPSGVARRFAEGSTRKRRHCSIYGRVEGRWKCPAENSSAVSNASPCPAAPA